MIHNINCLDFFLENEGKSLVDLSVTSPPYNLSINYGLGVTDSKSYEDYLHFSAQWLSGLLSVTKETGRLCLNIPLDTSIPSHCPVYADLTKVAMEVGWNYRTTVVWAEGNISRRTAFGSWKSASAPNVISPVEMIVVFYKGEWKKATKGISDITRDEFLEWSLGHWTFSGEKKKNVGGHPASFPLELPKRCIKLFSYVGDTVFDCFSGSGTTLVAAKQLNREYIGCEISKEYCDFAIERLKGA